MEFQTPDIRVTIRSCQVPLIDFLQCLYDAGQTTPVCGWIDKTLVFERHFVFLLSFHFRLNKSLNNHILSFTLTDTSRLHQHAILFLPFQVGSLCAQGAAPGSIHPGWRQPRLALMCLVCLSCDRVSRGAG